MCMLPEELAALAALEYAEAAGMDYDEAAELLQFTLASEALDLSDEERSSLHSAGMRRWEAIGDAKTGCPW